MSDPLEEETDSLIAAKVGFELFGKPLAPYSPMRKHAADRMGLLYPNIGEGGAAQYTIGGSYPGCVMDAAIVLWLCSIPDDGQKVEEEQASQFATLEWTPKRALRNPWDATSAALVWADSIGIGERKYIRFQRDAFQTFQAIIMEVEASKFTLSGGDAEEEQGDEKKV